MNKLPVTVIIPCYSCLQTLERALSSILDQSVLPSSVILISDGSPQKEQDQVRRLALQCPLPTTIICNSQNLGPGQARNQGWNRARTEYLAFLDADDSWHPQKLELQYQYMKKNPDVALSGHPCIVCKKATPSPIALPLEGQNISLWKLLLSNRFLTSSVLMKRSLPLRFGPGRYSEDYRLWLETVARGYKAILLNTPLAFLHKPPFLGPQGLSTNLWAMEQGELKNYLTLYHQGLLSPRHLLFVLPWSLGKFLLRLLRTQLTKLGTKTGDLT